MAGRSQGLGLAALVLAALSFVMPCHAGPPGYESDIRAYNLAHGRVVFADNCLRCHESGRRGAPIPGDADDWRGRLELPLDTLIGHAIAGHGDMPARGDREISDRDVAAAVAYVVSRARIIAADQAGAPPPAAESVDSSDEAVVRMFMLLLGRERWR